MNTRGRDGNEMLLLGDMSNLSNGIAGGEGRDHGEGFSGGYVVNKAVYRTTPVAGG